MSRGVGIGTNLSGLVVRSKTDFRWTVTVFLLSRCVIWNCLLPRLICTWNLDALVVSVVQWISSLDLLTCQYNFGSGPDTQQIRKGPSGSPGKENRENFHILLLY